jgi:hypothetical protein
MAIQFLDNVSFSNNISAKSINITEGVTINNDDVVKSPLTVMGAVSGISNIIVLDQISYDTLSPKLSTTLYVIV